MSEIDGTESIDRLEGLDEYKCDAFLSDEHNDPAMHNFYSLIKKFLRTFSKTFPHRVLFSRETLEGNWDDFEQTLPRNYRQWIDFESWWIFFGISLTTVCIFFTLLYIFYAVVRCCTLKTLRKASNTTDAKRDGCKRRCINILIAIFVIIDVFAVSSLLVSSQYAEYGADELPQRLAHCIDDLSLYKKETDSTIKQLLIDDYQKLNYSLLDALKNGGSSIVQKIKKVSGAHVIDGFLNISQRAGEIQQMAADVERSWKIVRDEVTLFENEISKIKKASTSELYDCLHNEADDERRKCQKVENLMSAIDVTPSSMQQQKVLTASTDKALTLLTNSKIGDLFIAAISDFKYMETMLDLKIIEHTPAVERSIAEIRDELLRIATSISTQLRQIRPELLQDTLKKHLDTALYHRIVQYTWYASLVLCAIFSLKALYFLFALFFGCFGRRPNQLKNDCCVKSTGSKLFNCGICFSIVLLPIFSVVTVVCLLIGANFYTLACWPLDDPFSRPDMLSLTERLIDVWRQQQIANDLSPLINQISIAELLRSCERNETLYQIFGLDTKYHLNDLRIYENDLYEQLIGQIDHSLHNFNLIKPISAFATPEQIDAVLSLGNVTVETNIDKITRQINGDLMQLDRVHALFAEITDEMQSRAIPQAVSHTIENLRVIQGATVLPVSKMLKKLVGKLAELSTKIAEFSLPGAALSVKLQHAHALLSSDFEKQFRIGANEFIDEFKAKIERYVDHVRLAMMSDVTSCVPFKKIVRGSRAALCQCFIDPFNGAWASLMISLLCTIPLVVLASSASSLYRKKYPYLKYIVHEPNGDVNMIETFSTDYYQIDNKTANGFGAHNGFPPPYMRTRN